MKVYIQKHNFVDWYFNTGDDQSIASQFSALGREVADSMAAGDDASITIEGIFDQCNHEIIPCRYFEGHRDDNYTEIGEFDETSEIILIESIIKL